MAAAAVSLFIAGCAKVPLLEVDAAKAALESAKAPEAALYAPDSFKAAENAVAAGVRWSGLN